MTEVDLRCVPLDAFPLLRSRLDAPSEQEAGLLQDADQVPFLPVALAELEEPIGEVRGSFPAIGLAALLYCVLPGWIGAACRSGRMPSREIWCAASPWRAANCVVEPECSPGDAVPFFVAAWGAALIAALLQLVVSVVRRGVAEVCRTTAQSARQRESSDPPCPERP